jgi:hypothetical protein
LPAALEAEWKDAPVTAEDEARSGARRVPTEPPPNVVRGARNSANGAAAKPPASAPTERPGVSSPPLAADAHTEVVEQETQLLTRAAIRAAEARRLAAEAEERRQASLAEEAAVPHGVRFLATGSAVALAALIGLSAMVGPNATALAVAFGSVVLAWGWVRLTDEPSPRTASLVLAGGAVAISAAAGLTRTDPYLVWVPVAVAVSVIAAFLHQVFRGGGRPRLTEGVAASVSALAVMASGSALIPVPHYHHGGPWVLVTVFAVGGAALPAAFLGRRLAGGWVLLAAVVLGAAVAVAAAVVVTGIALGWAALSGLLVAGISHSMTRVLSAMRGARSAPAGFAIGAAAVLVVGVVVYLLARIFAG